MLTKREKLNKRHRAIRSRVSGTKERPRLQVFRSSNHIYAQLIDDLQGAIIISESDKILSKEEGKKKKTEKAFLVGEKLAKKATEKKIKEVVFDRRGYLYHGRVKSLAEGARKGGLKF